MQVDDSDSNSMDNTKPPASPKSEYVTWICIVKIIYLLAYVSLCFPFQAYLMTQQKIAASVTWKKRNVLQVCISNRTIFICISFSNCCELEHYHFQCWKKHFVFFQSSRTAHTPGSTGCHNSWRGSFSITLLTYSILTANESEVRVRLCFQVSLNMRHISKSCHMIFCLVQHRCIRPVYSG